MERDILSACWGVPQAPGPTQECVGRTPCGAWWLPRPGGRLKNKDVAKAGNGVKGKMNAPWRAPDTVLGFYFWVDKAVKPQCGFTGPVPDFSLFPKHPAGQHPAGGRPERSLAVSAEGKSANFTDLVKMPIPFCALSCYTAYIKASERSTDHDRNEPQC